MTRKYSYRQILAELVQFFKSLDGNYVSPFVLDEFYKFIKHERFGSLYEGYLFEEMCAQIVLLPQRFGGEYFKVYNRNHYVPEFVKQKIAAQFGSEHFNKFPTKGIDLILVTKNGNYHFAQTKFRLYTKELKESDYLPPLEFIKNCGIPKTNYLLFTTAMKLQNYAEKYETTGVRYFPVGFFQSLNPEEWKQVYHQIEHQLYEPDPLVFQKIMDACQADTGRESLGCAVSMKRKIEVVTSPVAPAKTKRGRSDFFWSRQEEQCIVQNRIEYEKGHVDINSGCWTYVKKKFDEQFPNNTRETSAIASKWISMAKKNRLQEHCKDLNVEWQFRNLSDLKK
jgi:hypothetical protein